MACNVRIFFIFFSTNQNKINFFSKKKKKKPLAYDTISLKINKYWPQKVRLQNESETDCGEALKPETSELIKTHTFLFFQQKKKTRARFFATPETIQNRIN